MSIKTGLAILIGIAAGLCWQASRADSPGQNLPPGVDPARMLKEMQQTPPPPETAAPKVVLPDTPAPVPQAGADEIRFILGDVVVEGVTLLTAQETGTVIAPWIGKEISVAELGEIARQLTALYRGKGFVLASVQVPPQRIEKEGRIRLIAIEGELEAIDIQGGDPEGEPLIRSLLTPLLHDKSMTLARLEHALLIAQDLEGVEAQALMSPGSRDGLVKLTVKVTRDPVSFQLYYDNMNSKYQGPDRVIGTTQVNHLFGHSDYMRLSLQKTFDTSELTSWSILQGLMLGSEGTRLELSYTESITQPGENLRPYQFRGEARIASATVLMPLERGRYFNLRAQFGVQHLDSRQTAEARNAEVYHDRLDMLTAEGSVDWQDNWMGGGLSVLNLNYTQGISGDPGHPIPSRPHAEGQFGALEFFVNRFQTLTQRVSLQLAAGGQHASDPMVSSEQYSLGGYPFGRGFDMSSIAGDHGLAGKAELRYDVSDRFGGNLSQMMRQMSLFGFYDAGKVWSFHRDASSLAASGWGLRGVIDATPKDNVDKRSLDFEVFMAWKQHTPDGVNDDRPVVKARLILNF